MNHSPVQRDADRIQPWSEDHRYWQHRGAPLLLVGASNEDNLFNHPNLPPDGLAKHLDRMVSVGGNYVRNTMSSRDDGDVWPFAVDSDTGRYDLDRPNEEYFERFRRFLDMTAERRIIVQIELWDRFDYAREPWLANPFNPKNNINYTAESSGLPERIDTHPCFLENPFFRSLPELADNPVLRRHQEDHIRRIMDASLPHDHVLYCVSNETNDSEAWSAYWADFVRKRAASHRAAIEVTEMWDAHDLRDPVHARTHAHPERYSFIDASQNSQQVGQRQWDALQWLRERIAHAPRPINNVKMYGGVHGGGPDEGQHKLWRNVLGGVAAARYHRPGGGIGLNHVTEAHLASLRLLLETIDVFALQPAQDLLHERAEDAAYLAATPGRQYALYLPRGGPIAIDLSAERGAWRLRWLEVPRRCWSADVTVQAGGIHTLEAPSPAPWAAVILPD